MAPRTRVEEEFTDLSGKPDGTPDDQAGELERGLASLSRGDDDDIKDEDLEVSTEEDDEDGQSGGADEGDEDGEGEGEEDDQDEPNGASDFDPKDVQILLKDAELLDEKERSAKGAETQATADIAAARAKMKAAKEAGDTDADIDATDAYTKATIALENAKAAVANVANQKTALQGRAKELYAQAPKDAEGNAVVDGTKPARKAAKPDAESKLVPKFKSANKWFGNAKYSKQQKRLIELDRGLGAEGRLNKNTPEYFTELGKRFNREFPGLYRDLDGKPIATGERRRSAGAPIPGAGNTGRGGGGGGDGGGRQGEKVGLVAADLAQMRQFNLDPDNKEHRRTWLSEKRSLAASGRA